MEKFHMADRFQALRISSFFAHFSIYQHSVFSEMLAIREFMRACVSAHEYSRNAYVNNDNNNNANGITILFTISLRPIENVEFGRGSEHSKKAKKRLNVSNCVRSHE